MRYGKRSFWFEKYEYTSNNQHGMRYKCAGGKCVKASTIEADVTNLKDMTIIAILSDRLEAPITYNFDASPQTATIEVIAKRSIYN